MSKFTYNVGEIVLRENECFWIFPSDYLKNREYIICSPWFSFMGEKWRLVKDPYSEITVNEDTIFNHTYSNLIFRLWKKAHASRPKFKYITYLCLKRVHEDQFIKCVGEVHNDYGCELKFPDMKDDILSENGLVKLFFSMEKEEKISVIPETSNRESCSEEEDCEQDKENSDHSATSDDEESTEDENDNERKNFKPKGVQNLTQDLKQALLGGQMSDAIIKVENREFNVHKMMLAARSPVLASMFQHDMVEKNTNKIKIDDCKAESFEIFLHYLYTGNADAISESNVCNLYYAADKYSIADLKNKCVKFMKNNISLETFCDIISLSLRHGELSLKKLAIDFFCQNIKQIIKTVQWQKYITENPIQANELFIKALDA